MIYLKRNRVPRQDLFHENVKYQAITKYLDCYTAVETII